MLVWEKAMRKVKESEEKGKDELVGK